MNTETPKITCLPDGPYLIKVDQATTVSLSIQTTDGELASDVSGVALCRCGHSSNKPYCDGTHNNIGFSSDRLVDGSQDLRHSYAGTKITIHDNRGICAHAGICTNTLAPVFSMGEEPWIDPDGASVEQIIETVTKCPSGALSYSIDNIDYLETDPDPMVKVIKNGPYAVGGIELADQALGQGVSSGRYTLCRCGASKNKPFCDGSHWNIGFKDDSN